MVHGMEIPTVEQFKVELIQIEIIYVVERNLHTTLCRTEHDTSILIVGRRSDKMHHLWAVSTDEVEPHH